MYMVEPMWGENAFESWKRVIDRRREMIDRYYVKPYFPTLLNDMDISPININVAYRRVDWYVVMQSRNQVLIIDRDYDRLNDIKQNMIDTMGKTKRSLKKADAKRMCLMKTYSASTLNIRKISREDELYDRLKPAILDMHEDLTKWMKDNNSNERFRKDFIRTGANPKHLGALQIWTFMEHIERKDMLTDNEIRFAGKWYSVSGEILAPDDLQIRLNRLEQIYYEDYEWAGPLKIEG